jgi:hypothetical protein
MVKIGKDDINISFKYFAKILPFMVNHFKESSKPSKKLILSLS